MLIRAFIITVAMLVLPLPAAAEGLIINGRHMDASAFVQVPAVVMPTVSAKARFWTNVCQVAYWTGHGVDIAGTFVGIGAGTLREANPLLAWAEDNAPVFAAAKMAMAGASGYTVRKLKDTKPKLYCALALAGGAWFSFHGVRNFHLHERVLADRRR